MAPDLHRRSLVPTAKVQERLDQISHPPGFPADGASTPLGRLWIFFEDPLVEHPGMSAYRGKGSAQLVAGVGGKTSLAGEGLLPAGEGGFEPGQKAVYRGGEPADLILGVRHGQPLREVTLGHLMSGTHYGLNWPQSRPRQEIGSTDGEEKGHANAGGEDSLDSLDRLFGRLVRFSCFDYHRRATREADRHSVYVVG